LYFSHVYFNVTVLEIEHILRNNPQKAFWRGKSVQITARKPAKTTLAGKIGRGLHEIPRQIHFRGELRHWTANKNREAVSFRVSLSVEFS
jgi:hypothetical protein